MWTLDVTSDFKEPLVVKVAPDVGDDSADPTFLPSEQSESPRHDSDSEVLDDMLPEKRILTRKRRCKTKQQSDILRAQAVSLAIRKERQENITQCLARLDNLLSANRYIRSSKVAPDRNFCFFEAPVCHLEETSGRDLRLCVSI